MTALTENTSFDVIVIGAGPAGYVAAIRAAQLGMSVACIEKADVGGTCLNIGCIPSKALLDSSEHYATAKEKFKEHGISTGKLSFDLSVMMERKNAVVRQLTGGVQGLFKKNKVTHIVGSATLLKDRRVRIKNGKDETELVGRSILIATGSVPASIPVLPVDNKRIVDSTGALSLSEVPKHLIVVGGGFIGLELGSVYRRLGSEVTVVEALPSLVPALDTDLSKALERSLIKQGIAFRLSTQVLGATVKKSGVDVSIKDAKGESTLSGDYVLVAVGRRPYTDGLGLVEAGVRLDERGRIDVNEQFETSLPNVYAVGDVIRGPMLAHKASEEGVAVIERLAGQKPQVNHALIPSVVYTWPEVAAVGMTEAEAKAAGIDYKTSKFAFMATGRAIAMGEKEGFVKLIAERASDRLLGAHLIGPRASDLIAELVIAMEFSASAEDVARTIHAHPTLPEAIKEAALALGDGAIHA